MTSFAPEEFAPEEFVGGGQICNDEYPSKNSKNVDFDWFMNAFFDERYNYKFSCQTKIRLCQDKCSEGLKTSLAGLHAQYSSSEHEV